MAPNYGIIMDLMQNIYFTDLVLKLEFFTNIVSYIEINLDIFRHLTMVY
jgi:hypothetical protein